MNDVWLPRHTLIVGAGSGLGTRVATLAADAGSHLALVARSQSTLDAAVTQVRRNGSEVPVRTLLADAADPQSLSSVLNSYADNAIPPVDCALFNVSVWVPGGLEADLSAVSAGLDAGSVSALAIAQALVPMMEQLPRAALAFTGGGSADAPMTASLGLGMQKAAMRNLAFGLAKELQDTSVRVKTLTIHGTIAPDTAFDPVAIAGALWNWARDDSATVERDFTGD